MQIFFKISGAVLEKNTDNTMTLGNFDNALNEIKGHCKNEVWVNSDRIKYADQFLLTKLDEIVTGL